MISHNVKEGVLGNSLIVYDTTTLQEYTDLGIDINTDIVSVTFTIAYNEMDYFIDITSDFNSLRDGNGLEILISDLIGIDQIPDDVYYTSLEIVENSMGSEVAHTSVLDVVFYEIIKYQVISTLKDTDWKEYFGCYTSKLKTPLRCYNWLLNLEYTSELQLYNDAERILNSLKAACQ